MNYLKKFQILCLIVVIATIVDVYAEAEKVSKDAESGVKEKRGLISGYTGETSRAVPSPATVYGTPSNLRLVVPQGTSASQSYASLGKFGPVTFGVSNDLGASTDNYQGLLSSYVPSKSQISSVQAVPSYAVGSRGLGHYASGSYSGIPAATYGVPALSGLNLNTKGSQLNNYQGFESQTYAPASSYTFDSSSHGNSYANLNNLLSSGIKTPSASYSFDSGSHGGSLPNLNGYLSSGSGSVSITPSISVGLELPSTSEANFASIGSSYAAPSNTYLPAHSSGINLGSGGDVSYSSPLIVSSSGTKHSSFSSGGNVGGGLGYFTGDAGLSSGISGNKIEFVNGGISSGYPSSHGYSTGIISGANEGYSGEGLSLGNVGYSSGGVSIGHGVPTGGISLGSGYSSGPASLSHGFSAGSGGISLGHGYAGSGVSHEHGYSSGGISHGQTGYLSDGFAISSPGYTSGGFSGGNVAYQGISGASNGHSSVGHLSGGAGYNSYTTGASQCSSGNGVSTTYGPPGYCPPNLIRLPSTSGYSQITSPSHNFPAVNVGGSYKQNVGVYSGGFGKPATTYGTPFSGSRNYNTIRYSSALPGKGYYP